MESNQNLHVNQMIEKLFMQSIEHDLSAFQHGEHDEHSTNKKLLLMHLFMQLYQDKPSHSSVGTNHQIDEAIQQVDALQQQADTFLDDIKQKK